MVYRVLITGSRSWHCRVLADRVLSSLIARHGADSLVIVHGACPTGVDKAFDEASHEAILEVERYPADWTRYGKSAGPRRNAEMVALGANLCLAFHPTLDPVSGTADTVRRALKAGIPTWWINHEDGVPIRQRLPESSEAAAPAAGGDQ